MRLIIVVEGQSEEGFVKEVLGPYLDARGVYTSASIVGKMIARKRGHRGRGGGHLVRAPSRCEGSVRALICGYVSSRRSRR